jgi:glycosyltransferase involved in cell wall biosynthesis
VTKTSSTGAPVVSVGMPVLDGEKYMAETIDSILGQDVDGLELIISDNASTDATEAIARSYAARDPRARYVRNERNVGAARNYNQLVDLAQGRYFKWAGYDDLLRPGYLRRCIEVLDAEPEVVIAYPRTDIIDGAGDLVRHHDDNMHLSSPDPVARVRHFARTFTLCNPCFGVIRRDLLLRTSLVQPFVSSDIPLLVELALLGKWHEVPDRLFLRRIHETSSRQGRVTILQVAHWFDPERGRPLAPRTRMVAETLRSIERAHLPASVRARAAAAFLSTWALRRARVRGGQAKAAVRRRRPGRAGPSTSPAPRAGMREERDAGYLPPQRVGARRQ